MEMEAGGACSKMRRRGRADRISNLDDDTLRHIISVLPIKDGARTPTLASRWRHLWRSAPLSLDSHGLAEYGDVLGLARARSRILSSHQGPGDPTGTVDPWLRSAALCNLQQLEVCYGGYRRQLPPLPASISRFSHTLRVATFGQCSFPDNVQGLEFPLLRLLTLEQVSISRRSLHSMIAGSRALECLMIRRSLGFHVLRINSPTIRTIGVSVGWYSTSSLKLGELVIENAPCLKRLLFLNKCSDLHVSVISAPELETLRLLSDPSIEILFGSTVIQGFHVDKLTTAMPSVKILAVDSRDVCLDAVINLMGCFPCLEKLYIQSVKYLSCDSPCHEHHNLIERLDIRLKTLVLEVYYGTMSHVSFVTFFVLNAQDLELVILGVRARNNYEEFLASEGRKLQLENKVSRDAQIHFTTSRSVCSFSNANLADNIDLADPFTVET